MKKQYTITKDKFLEAKKTITENDGTIYADGSFEVSGVEGSFSYDEGILTVKITDKPWLASWEMIGEKMDEFFTGGNNK